MEKLWIAPVATEIDLDDAVKAAHGRFRAWAGTSIEDRKQLVERWAKRLEYHEDQFTELLIHESGKPRMIADLEVKVALSTLAQSCMSRP